jgi:hypothetical protein
MKRKFFHVNFIYQILFSLFLNRTFRHLFKNTVSTQINIRLGAIVLKCDIKNCPLFFMYFFKFSFCLIFKKVPMYYQLLVQIFRSKRKCIQSLYGFGKSDDAFQNLNSLTEGCRNF